MRFSWRHLVVGMVLMAAAAAAEMLTPRHGVDKSREPDLAALMPKHFGGWREVPMMVSQVTTTVTDRETENAIYDQTIMRNFSGPHGELVMVAIAYGVRQNDELKVHRPEVCYRAAGFRILKTENAMIRSGEKNIPVTEMVTVNGSRIEPVTYWIRIGKEIMHGGAHERLAVIKAGLMGNVPDGLLFRVSSIVGSESKSAEAFEAERAFLEALMGSMDGKKRAFLVGS